MTTPSREPWWRLPRLRLAHLPTPLDEMAHLSRQLGGPMFLVKRDDLTGLAGGGNKARKLEFIIADAVGHGADVVLTVGGWQSNHCRQTAAAAAIAGLDCHLVLGGESRPPVGNLLLDHILGATIHWTSRAHRMEMLAQLAEELRDQGRQPYVVPLGGSSALGAVGYVAAMFELADQLAKRDLSVDRVLFATSSGGTQAGIVLGARLAGFSAAITAISIDQLPDGNSTSPFLAGVCRTANEA
ncbi:MAG TPA: pyridoxal-phosphate dependent enzyme, partial [Lacipirellulaceae bacterium]|nr:pyridoxal-phosphate dependent enzyme [Lacipirellulaceae bacterium]